MIQTRTEGLTLEAFLALPETKPASEYIDGCVTQKPMPGGKHSRLQTCLLMAIDKALDARKIACVFPELICVFAGRCIVPDVSVFLQDRLPLDETGEITNELMAHPDWIVEVLSPEQSQKQVWDKVLHAVDNGTQMGWLIDPDNHSILICQSGQSSEKLIAEDQVLAVPEFAVSLRLTVGDVFGWLKFNR